MNSRPESAQNNKNKSAEKILQTEAQIKANEKLKLPENKKPSVLDRNTIWNEIRNHSFWTVI